MKELKKVKLKAPTSKFTEILNTYPRVEVIEAYTNVRLQVFNTPVLLDPKRIVEIRLRADENVPTCYYETDNSKKFLEEKCRTA